MAAVDRLRPRYHVVVGLKPAPRGRPATEPFTLGAQMRLLVYVTLLLSMIAATHPAIAQEAADDYEQQLREYDQRVAEAQQWESQQQWKRLTPLFVIFGFLFIYLVYSQIAARRKYNAIMLQSQQNFDRAIQQNQEMINLLKSIDERLERGT